MQHRGGPPPEDTRNMIIAVVLMMAILIGFQMFYETPRRERLIAAEQARIEAQQEAAPAPAERIEAAPAPAEEILTETAAARIAVDTASVDGSISLRGARFDDLNLRGYRVSIDRDSAEVRLLSPQGGTHSFDAFFGWEEREARFAGVGASDVWSAPEGARLTVDAPLVLSFATGDGIEVTRTISVDANYMFTVSDEVRNTTGEAREVRPFGVVRSHGLPDDYKRQSVVHQGMVGVFGPNPRLNEARFEDAAKHARRKAEGRIGDDTRLLQDGGQGGWLGVTDHYWMTAIVPDQSTTISAFFDSEVRGGINDFRAAYRAAEWSSVPAGGSITYTQRLFAGAKRVDLIRAYQRELAIPDFDKAVDWGMFWFLTRPFFAMLDFFGKLFGNFGLGILASTVVIKAALFPLVYQSYKSMAKMRALQPKMKEIQERYAADKQRMQQEQMRLFQTEKINPVAGCLPILLQIPVFFALFKVLSVTIEMRHAPFFGWIRDLSAPDPSSIFNLFGLLPAIGFDFHSVPLLNLIPAIGVWPLLYGVSMWALQALSPPPTDPVQAKIFQFLPVVFTIMFASFPAGMVIYWTWSNTLSILQQYVIMRRQGVETQLDLFLAKRFGNRADPVGGA